MDKFYERLNEANAWLKEASEEYAKAITANFDLVTTHINELESDLENEQDLTKKLKGLLEDAQNTLYGRKS